MELTRREFLVRGFAAILVLVLLAPRRLFPRTKVAPRPRPQRYELDDQAIRNTMKRLFPVNHLDTIPVWKFADGSSITARA